MEGERIPRVTVTRFVTALASDGVPAPSLAPAVIERVFPYIDESACAERATSDAVDEADWGAGDAS